MTGLLDSRARATAERLISRYGKSMTLTSVVVDSTDYAPATGTISSVSTDYAVVGVVATPSRAAFDSTLAEHGDISVLLAASPLTVVPKAGDLLLINSVTWRAIDVRRIFSGELVAMYEVLAKGSG